MPVLDHDGLPQCTYARRRILNAGIAAGLLMLGLSLTPPLTAQEAAPGENSRPSMQEGEARISLRSDVRMTIEGARGTNRSRLEALGKEVSTTMPGLRACYAALIEEDPTVRGEVRTQILLDKGAPQVSFASENADAGSTAPGLLRCLSQHLGTLKFRDVERPAAASILLAFENSGAQGYADVKAHREQDAREAVTQRSDGKPEARWTTADGKVAFIFTGVGKTTPEVVAGTYRTVREQFAVFLDCRRRASKRNSPAGHVDVRLGIRAGKTASAKASGSSIPDPRAPACMERAFKRLRYAAQQGAGDIDVRVTFAD